MTVAIDTERAVDVAHRLQARSASVGHLAATVRQISNLGQFSFDAIGGLALLDEVVEEVGLLGELYSARAGLARAADSLWSSAGSPAGREEARQRLSLVAGRLALSLLDSMTFDANEVARHFALIDLEARMAKVRDDLEERVPELEARLAELDSLDDPDGILEWLGDINPFAESRGERRAEERSTILALLDLLEPSAATGQPRQFLTLDDRRGDHRLVEVVGDLGRAERVVVHIPGMTTQLQNYAGGGHSDVTNLYREADRIGGDGTVIVSFMDYDVPQDLMQAASGSGADSGVDPLRRLLADVDSIGIGAENVTVVAHSYGSVVAGHAMQDSLDVARVITLGSPGMAGGADDRTELGSPDVELWSARSGSDLVRFAPVHGEDPGDDGFGANRFSVGGAGGHGSYFTPRTQSLHNIVRLAIGRTIR